MSFQFITGDEQGHIYTVTDQGDLLYYRDEGRNGTGTWANGGIGRQIGSGWEDFQQVFSGGDGILYAVDARGALLYYRDLARDGTSSWAFGGVGQHLAEGFDQYARVISGGDGIIYAVALNGDLYYYRDEARDGTARWSYGGERQKIGNGWRDFRHIVSGGSGVFYVVNLDGDLFYYRDEARNGNRRWAFGETGQQIGTGWGFYPQLMSGGDGIIYAVTADGALLFFKDEARNGQGVWANGGRGAQVGAGWYVTGQRTTVEGYCVPISVEPGDTINFKISARADYDVTYVRLRQQADGSLGIPLTLPFRGAAGMQSAPDEVWDVGCGWQTTFSLKVPTDWQSGMYAARCFGLDGSDYYVVFVVKPLPSRRADIAVLANINTWNAYNGWGGRSKYTDAGHAPVMTFERPNPATSPIDDGQPNHTTRAELWVLDWLENAGYPVDMYSDYDFHNGIDGFGDYKALILNTHPEYWTLEMRDNLEEYLAAGGNLLYLGGNGIFEVCQYIRNDDALLFEGGDPSLGRDRKFFRNVGRPERDLLGVAFLFNNYLTVSPPAPYRVEQSGHRFFANTGLKEGDLIGNTGHNGAASGWEMDWSEGGTAPDGVIVSAWEGSDRGTRPGNTQVLARGTNAAVDGNLTAHMTYYRALDGGFVFSVGSLCFGGSLAQDPMLQKIVRNVLDECLASPP